MTTIRADLRALLERVVIAQRHVAVGDAAPHELDLAIRHVAEVLDARREMFEYSLAELRARIAMHFAPRDAIAYDRSNPIPRNELVLEYLKKEFVRPEGHADTLARDVAELLDQWDVSRERLNRYAAELLRLQGNRCRSCGVVLWPEPTPELVGDHYKPYYVDSANYLSVEVDHREPVSRFGSNDLANLQALCRLCNQGKGDLSGVDVGHEFLFAATPIREVRHAHRAKMVYYVLSRCQERCARTGLTAREAELTIRPIRKLGGYIRSNLIAVAVSALKPDERQDVELAAGPGGARS